MINFEQYLYDHATGSTFLQVTGKTLKEMPVPYPGEEKGQHLVEDVEKLFSKLDEAEKKIDQAFAAFPVRRAALLHRAFQGDLTKAWRKDHGMGMESWENSTLGKVAHWGSGGTPSRKHPEYFNGHIAWVKTGELLDDYIEHTEEKITETAIENSSAKLYPVHTVIVAMYGATIGKTGILNIEAATNQACACAVCSDELYYRFLFYYLQSQKPQFINIGKGGAQPNISQTVIKNYPISVPTLPEQQEIVRLLDRLLGKEDKAKAAAEAMKTRIAALRASILARAFRGAL